LAFCWCGELGRDGARGRVDYRVGSFGQVNKLGTAISRGIVEGLNLGLSLKVAGLWSK
jgi:hypothetical protein